MNSPNAGVHYPGNLAAVRSWFPDDAACLDYLDWLRWPHGFRCTHCGCEKGWRLPAGGWSCGGCRKRVRVLAGTVLQDTRTPLTVWFEAAWLMAVTKNGVSAASLKPLLGLGSYETAWAMCHKLRTAMGRTSLDLLSGDVEVDETFIGGVKTGGKRGRGTSGKAYVVIAVESKEHSFGRCRLEVVPKIDAEHLGKFLHEHIAPGSVVISDALRSYHPRSLTPSATSRSTSSGLACAPTRSCLASTGSPACSSGGSPAPTNPASPPSTCPPTSTNSRSASIVATREPVGSCSFGCSKAP